ncbi:hypothetical protein TUSST3_75420 [Streptomyces sp. TUS-ST3]|nr:hypothetical protein TUSST3_75420 [Streptomyces sp. TUS-ST3]
MPAGAFTDGAEQVTGADAEAVRGSAEAVGRYTAAASGTPAATAVRSRLIACPSKEVGIPESERHRFNW